MNQLCIGGGLNNLGNTCFFNAALQSVLHTPILSILFKKQQHSKQCPIKNTNQWCVFCEMQNIYLRTRQAKSFSPNNMIKNLKHIFKKFKLGRQEDAHEFLRYLVEGMQENETGKLGKQRQANEQKIRKTTIFKSLGGIIKTQVFCLNCKHKSITSQRYYDFNIDKECQSSNTLNEGINRYFAVDKLENNNKYYCQNCKTRSNATKRFLLEQAPQTVTFQFKRFTNSMRKIGKFIQYPLTLDIGKYLQDPHKVLMKLYAIIVHAGGTSQSGHYYAFVRVNELWYKMDDSYVSKMSIQSILNQNAYILFYEKVFEEQQIVKQKPIIQKNTQVNHNKQTQIILEITQSRQSNGIIKHPATQIIKPKEIVILQQKKIILQKPKQVQPQLKKAEEVKVIVQKKEQKQQKQQVQESQQQLQQDEQSQELIAPLLLVKKKSKSQLQKTISPQKMKKLVLNKLVQLFEKLPESKPRNSSKRSFYHLRKYEMAMQKKRKIGN